MKAMISWSPQLRSHTKAPAASPQLRPRPQPRRAAGLRAKHRGSKECVKPFREILRLSCARCTLQTVASVANMLQPRDRKSGKQVGCSCSIEELPTWPCQDFSDFERFQDQIRGSLAALFEEERLLGLHLVYRLRRAVDFQDSRWVGLPPVLFLIRETSTVSGRFSGLIKQYLQVLPFMCK